jgi:hypothetical protein
MKPLDVMVIIIGYNTVLIYILLKQIKFQWLVKCILLHIEMNFIFLNPLNAELNPNCHLLALLEAHPILHVSRIRVNNI